MIFIPCYYKISKYLCNSHNKSSHVLPRKVLVPVFFLSCLLSFSFSFFCLFFFPSFYFSLFSSCSFSFFLLLVLILSSFFMFFFLCLSFFLPLLTRPESERKNAAIRVYVRVFLSLSLFLSFSIRGKWSNTCQSVAWTSSVVQLFHYSTVKVLPSILNKFFFWNSDWKTAWITFKQTVRYFILIANLDCLYHLLGGYHWAMPFPWNGL